MSGIRYLSPPLPVHMADAWFETATLGHFWVRRRFEAFRALWGGRPLAGAAIAEFGCGHGLVLRQFEEQLGLSGDGFDLNEGALKQSVVRDGRLFCYDVHQRLPEFREAYDLAVLFDVIEHIEDDAAFLRSVLFHLKPGGRIAVNVPAHMSLFSWYDTRVGHQRRYDIGTMRASAAAAGLKVDAFSYWGNPYVPLLQVRRRRKVPAHYSEAEAVDRGFRPPGRLANAFLLALGRMERLPRNSGGTSLLAILSRA